MAEATIRPITLEDRELVNDFFTRLGAEGNLLFNPKNCNYNLMNKFFDGQTQWLRPYMAEEEGVMVGIMFLSFMNTTIPSLGIAIVEGYKGKGLGTRLMKHAEAVVRKCGKGGIRLSTHIANLRGQNLYSKMNYELIGRTREDQLLYLRRFEHKVDFSTLD